jgi:nucleotide-binding universal stress UspA family protein
MFETIVWATDGSEAADRALPYVKELADRFGAKVVAAHSEEFLLGPRAGGQPVHVDEDELQAKIKGQVEQLKNEGVDAEFKLTGGPSLEGAAHMVAKVARETEADLIVAGTRGHTPLAGLLVGAVTQRLLHIAPCAVMAIPPARKHAEKGAADAAAAAAGTSGS